MTSGVSQLAREAVCGQLGRNEARRCPLIPALLPSLWLDVGESCCCGGGTAVAQLPTLPFEEAEVEDMLAAADTFSANGKYGAGNRRRAGTASVGVHPR
jgi:hypothetical protein